jgi:hypothetical protein
MYSIYLYNNLANLILQLQCNSSLLNNTNNIDIWFKDKIIVSEEIYPIHNYNSIRIWKSLTLFSYYFENMNDNNYIGGIDYFIIDNILKIEYIEDNNNINIINGLLDYIINIGKKNNCKKIIIELHENLENYNKYYKSYCFELTNERCCKNSFWIVAEKLI